MKLDFLFGNKLSMALVFFVLIVPIVLHNVSWYFVLPSILCVIFVTNKKFVKFIISSSLDGWCVSLLFFYFLISSCWAYSQGQVVSTFINQIFKPMVCFFCVAWLIYKNKVTEKQIGSMFFLLGLSVFILTIICLVIGGKYLLWKVFYDLGYYSTFVVLIAAACIPFLDPKKRCLYYPMIAFMFFLTDQRVVWILYPCIVIADVLISVKKLSWKNVLYIALTICFSYLILKYLQEIRPADAFKVVNNQESMGLLDYLLRNERLVAWVDWAKRGMAHPFFGVGFGKENAIQYFSSQEVWNISKLYHAHNVFLNTFVQTGMVGLLLLLLTYTNILLKLKKSFNNSIAIFLFLVIVFYIIRNQFDCFDSKRIMMVYFSLLGVGYGYIVRWKKFD